MTPRLEDRHKAQITRLFQGCLLGFIIVGTIEHNIRITINSIVGLLVTLIPESLEKDYNIAMSPLLVLWIVTAVLLHAIGTLGPYGNIWWWDHLTHTLSASVVAAAGYAAFRALDEHMDDLYLPKRFMFVFLLVFVMAFGVIWEVIEFFATLASQSLGAGEVVVQYGLEDTMKDLMFDAAGAIIVAVFGAAYLTNVIDSLKQKLEEKVSLV